MDWEILNTDPTVILSKPTIPMSSKDIHDFLQVLQTDIENIIPLDANIEVYLNNNNALKKALDANGKEYCGEKLWVRRKGEVKIEEEYEVLDMKGGNCRNKKGKSCWASGEEMRKDLRKVEMMERKVEDDFSSLAVVMRKGNFEKIVLGALALCFFRHFFV